MSLGGGYKVSEGPPGSSFRFGPLTKIMNLNLNQLTVGYFVHDEVGILRGRKEVIVFREGTRNQSISHSPHDEGAGDVEDVSFVLERERCLFTGILIVACGKLKRHFSLK